MLRASEFPSAASPARREDHHGKIVAGTQKCEHVIVEFFARVTGTLIGHDDAEQRGQALMPANSPASLAFRAADAALQPVSAGRARPGRRTRP